MPDPSKPEEKEACAICGQPSDELSGEGECPGCVDEREAMDEEMDADDA